MLFCFLPLGGINAASLDILYLGVVVLIVCNTPYFLRPYLEVMKNKLFTYFRGRIYHENIIFHFKFRSAIQNVEQ